MVNGDKPLGGIDLGGTKIQAVVVDGRHMILGQARRATPMVGGPPDIVAAMAATLEDAVAQAGCSTSDLAGVGVGAPGAASFETGVLAHAPNLPGWEDPYPLAAELSTILGAPVVLGNDVGVAVDAEFQLGAGKPYNSILGIWWGTGVGGGIVLDGSRWLGRGAAGEFGHTIVKLGGRAEPKGLRGTVEAYAGRAAMEARARKLVRRGHKTKLFAIMEKTKTPSQFAYRVFSADRVSRIQEQIGLAAQEGFQVAAMTSGKKDASGTGFTLGGLVAPLDVLVVMERSLELPQGSPDP